MDTHVTGQARKKPSAAETQTSPMTERQTAKGCKQEQGDERQQQQHQQEGWEKEKEGWEKEKEGWEKEKEG